MAHTEEMLIHGIMTPVNVIDSSAQEIDDAVARLKNLTGEALIGKPSGSYTGNKNLPRIINTGGVGDVIAIRVILGSGENGPIYYINGDVAIKGIRDGTVQILTDHATFHDGVLTINHLNLNGSSTGGNMKYYYQVL